MNYSCKTLRLYTLFCVFFCCLCIFAANNSTSSFSLSAEIKLLLNLEADNYLEKNNVSLERDDGVLIRGRMRGARRVLLGGLGSSPPHCAKKCGGCRPCKPVHEPVPPGRRVTTEYYPEAWRCKCGNKSYMP